MKKILLAAMAVFVFSVPASAECNQNEARSIIQQIVNGGLADRQDEGGITIWYVWKGNWYGMSKEQQFGLIDGIAGAEHCIRPGVATRIRVAGKDVARGSIRGVELLD